MGFITKPPWSKWLWGSIRQLAMLDIKVIHRITLSFTPFPLCFHPLSPLSDQRYPQSNEILLNPSMKCWNSAFNAHGSRVIIVVLQVGAVKIYVAAVEALTKEGMKLSLPPKLVEKLVWVPVILFCKISFPMYAFDALLCLKLTVLAP